MRTIEFKSQTNNSGVLEINYPLKTKNKNVRVVVFIEDDNEDEEKLWLQSMNTNLTFDFLKEEDDIYTLNDGNAI